MQIILYQVFMIIFSAGMSFLVAHQLQKAIFVTAPHTQSKWFLGQQRVTKIAIPPLCFILFISMFSWSLASYFLGNSFLPLAIHFGVLWFIISILWLMTSHKKIVIVLGCMALLSFILGVFDLWTPFTHYLDSFSFVVGSIRISIYKLFKALTLLLLISILIQRIILGVKRIFDSYTHLQGGFKEWLIRVIQGFLYFVALLLILGALDVNLTSLTIFSGAIGVGIGFGMQKFAANCLSGVILLAEKNIRMGDLLELSNGDWAKVQKLGLRSTLLELTSGKEVIIPNEELISQSVTNLTLSHTKLRIEVILPVSYQCDLEKARLVILEALKKSSWPLAHPTPGCFLSEWKEGGAYFTLFFWIKDVSQGMYQPRSEVLLLVIQALKEGSFMMPAPHFNVNLLNNDSQKT